MTTESWGPVGSSERYRSIDIIRGLALFGVLIVNLLTDFRLPLMEHMMQPHETGVNQWVSLFSGFALEFKAFSIFSFLFGAGTAIQMERAGPRNINARIFLGKRFGWLLVFGLIHLFLIWNGDILTLYAVCGLLLLPILGLDWRLLLVLGAACIALPEISWFDPHLPSGTAATAAIAEARQVYGNEGFLKILRFRWRETWFLIVPLLVAVLPRTAGLMCCGVAAWRSGILRNPEQYRQKLIAALFVGATVGGILTFNEMMETPWPALTHTHLDPSILLAMAYVSGLLLWLTPRRCKFLPGLAAMGQTALTNYLFQSIVCGLIFYGYGFGLLGKIGSAATFGIGLALYAVQMQVSRAWLRSYRFGPFEWGWRSLTYGQRQRMR